MLILNVALAVVGGIVVIWNLAWFWRMRDLFGNAIVVEGVVVRMDIDDGRLRQSGTIFRYVVCYRAEGLELETPVTAKRYDVGARVPVRYRPGKPMHAVVGSLPEILFGPSFMLAWGIAFLIGAIVV